MSKLLDRFSLDILRALDADESRTTIALAAGLRWAYRDTTVGSLAARRRDLRTVAPRLRALRRRGLIERTAWLGYGYDMWVRTETGTAALDGEA